MDFEKEQQSSALEDFFEGRSNEVPQLEAGARAEVMGLEENYGVTWLVNHSFQLDLARNLRKIISTAVDWREGKIEDAEFYAEVMEFADQTARAGVMATQITGIFRQVSGLPNEFFSREGLAGLHSGPESEPAPAGIDPASATSSL